MYRKITDKQYEIFNGTLCNGTVRLQDCPNADLHIIFDEGIPDRMWFDISALVETSLECSGLGIQLSKYFFTNCT